MRFVNWAQAGVLSERYVAVLWGDLGGTLLLLLQVPVIGGLICLSWASAAADAKLYFCLCLAAIWLGCINSCREIVKERPLYARERMVNLEIPAYVVSKLQVQAGFSAAQCILLLAMVSYGVGLPGWDPVLFIPLWLGALTGATLGLCISAAAGSTDQAVTMVPIAMLPQIIFTKMILPEGSRSGPVEWIERLNPLRWTLDFYRRVSDFSKEPAWGECFKSAGILVLFSTALFAGAMLILWMQEE